MGVITWGQELAEVYDSTNAAGFEASVLDPMVDLLAELAHGGPALEFAVGTGRVALPLSARGVQVRGIELSEPMAAQLRAKRGAEAVPVTVGDMTTTRIPGSFTFVYLVANTIMNVTTQDEQLAVFANAPMLPALKPVRGVLHTAVAPKLTLVKTVDNDDSGGTATATDWTLTAVNGGSTITGTSGSGSVTGAAAVVGTYALSESGGPPGYTASDWVCTGATGTTGTTVTLQPGDDATCTITNTAERPQLTLVKVVDNTSAGGATEAAAWTLTAVNGASTISGKTGSGDVTDAPAVVGTYSLSEADGPDGYTASDWTCTGASSSTADSVTLALTDSATCTITNTAIPPTLTLVKTVDNGQSGATHTAEEWTLSASGPVDISGATGAGAVTDATVKVGTYQLDEDGPAGYQTDGWTCDGADDTTPTSVTLGPGQSATCAITNTAIVPALTLVKEVHNEHGGTREPADWTLKGSGPVTVSGHTGTAPVTAAQVPIGWYDLSESGPSGYEASTWTCVDGTVSGATVQVGLGANVICTITNTDIAAPPPAPPLSFTGAQVMTWTKLAILLLLSGGVLLFAGRRRRWI